MKAKHGAVVPLMRFSEFVRMSHIRIWFCIFFMINSEIGGLLLFFRDYADVNWLCSKGIRVSKQLCKVQKCLKKVMLGKGS